MERSIPFAQKKRALPSMAEPFLWDISRLILTEAC